MPMFPMKTQITTAPDLIAFHPKAVSKRSGNRKGTEPTTIVNRAIPLLEARKVRIAKTRSSRRGTGVRRRCQTAAAMNNSETSAQPLARAAGVEIVNRCAV